jgi:hypothetical protein
MKKIIMTINSRLINRHSIEFASYIARITHSRLSEIFIEDPGSHGVNLEGASGLAAAEAIESIARATTTKPHMKSPETRTGDDAPNEKGILTVCDKLDDVLEKIALESRFADLLIVDATTSFEKNHEDKPTHFVKEVLAHAECPVIIAPETFNEDIEDIIFCYDGSASSVFAIKLFTYLFGEFDDRSATILHVDESASQSTSRMENEKIIDWLQSHYASVNLHSLSGTVQKELYNYLLNKEKSFVVFGAYGRSIVSNFFRKSHADPIIKGIDLPIFITHH